MFAQDHTPQRYKAEIRSRWQPVIRRWLAAATQRMLDLAQIQPGAQILGVAAGDGDPALQAARRAGPGGRVVVIGSSDHMLAGIARSAQEAGIANLKTLAMDGEKLAFANSSFDAVICRFGLIFTDDILVSLQQMQRVLKPGGRACVMAFTRPERNDFISTPLAIIRSRLPKDSPNGRPDLFRLGDRGALETALSQAGFRLVETHILAAPLRLHSAAEFVRFERESFAILHTLMSSLDEAAREEVWREVAAAFARFDSSDGFTAAGEVTVGMGAKCG